MAMGMEVVPIESPVIINGTAGIKYPMAIPTAMARKIQSVRYRSRNESCFVVFIGFHVMLHFFLIGTQNSIRCIPHRLSGSQFSGFREFSKSELPDLT